MRGRRVGRRGAHGAGEIIEAEMLRGASFRQSSWLAVKLAFRISRWRFQA